MASIEGLTRVRKDSLASVVVGNLILANQLLPRPHDGYGDSDSDEYSEDGDDSNEDSDPDSDDDCSGSDSQVGSGSSTPHPAHMQVASPQAAESDHAEHIGDTTRSEAAPTWIDR